MKLEVGQYVRIQWGNGEQTISKCTNKFDMGDTQYSKNDFYIHTDKKGEVIYKSMILKASHNIIDLIEPGDYVNGDYVWEDTNGAYFKKGTMWVGDLEQGDYLNKTKIETIVTREQFEAMQYKGV